MKIAGKSDKNGRKIDKNCAKIALFFCTFSVFILLKFLRVMDWGPRPPVAPPSYAPDQKLHAHLICTEIHDSVGNFERPLALYYNYVILLTFRSPPQKYE